MKYPTEAELSALLASVAGITVPSSVDVDAEIQVAIAKAETLTGCFPLMAGTTPTTREYDPVHFPGYGAYGSYGLVDTPNTIGYPIYVGYGPAGAYGRGYSLDLHSKARTVDAIRIGDDDLPETNVYQLDRTGTKLTFSAPPFGISGTDPVSVLGAKVYVDADFGRYASGELPADLWDAIRKLAAASILGINRESNLADGLGSWDEAGIKETRGYELTLASGRGWFDDAVKILTSPVHKRVAFF